MLPTHVLRTEAIALLHTSWPMMFSYFLAYLVTVVDVTMIGHLGAEELAAAAIGNLIVSSFCYPLLDITTALDTLLSQCYGAGNFRAYGEWFVTGIQMCFVVFVPIFAFVWNSEKLLLALGQDPHLAKLGGEFSRWLLLGILPFFCSYTFSVYLQVQHVTKPMVWVGVATNVLNVLFNYWFIFELDMGLKGSALATSLSRWFQCLIFLFLVVCYVSHRPTRPRPSLAPLHPSRALVFFRLGLVGVAAIAVEIWCFDAMTAFSGLLDEVSLGAHAVMLNVAYLIYMTLQYPLGIGAQIRLGICLGSNRPDSARIVAIVGLLTVFVASVLTMVSCVSVCVDV
eukprot:c7658_g1_i2.p1 GENE.c7658_g1_i2~~c7658_g1_i2.p1  ORF type:complete len:340 (+),score=39.07 c7658_g1_i2:173-1192(+)